MLLEPMLMMLNPADGDGPDPQGAPRRRAVEHYLAEGWETDQVEALRLHQGFHGLFPLFLALTRGANEAGFVVRVTFIRELFAHMRDRYWDKDAMQRSLPWLSSDALDYLVGTFKQYGWLEFDRTKGYSWSELGVNAAAMLGMMAQGTPQRQEMGIALYGIEFCLQMGYDPLDVLYNLRSRFDSLAVLIMEALESHSEVKLLEVQDQLENCIALSQETRRVLDNLDLTRKDLQAEYQAIHLHLSQLHAYRSELLRSLTALGEQFVTLEGGINQLDITRMLIDADVKDLAEIAADAFRCPAFIPPIFDPALLIAAAEYQLNRELIEVEEEQWNEPVAAATVAVQVTNRETIAEAVADLERFALAKSQVPLFEFATVDEPALAMYRLSLLPLVGTPVAPGERVDSPVQRLKLVPVRMEVTPDAPMLQQPTPLIKEITEAYLRPFTVGKDAHV
ncbi:hypothetical protein D3C72_702600 [compost metagenome]